MSHVQEHHASLGAYVTGFVLSLFLTLVAYTLVVNDVIDTQIAIAGVVCLALAQFFVQVVFFLHLGREGKPRWNLMTFLFMILVVFIVVAGSLWIMANLDYNMKHGKEMDAYMNTQRDKGF